ncbi:hypothetical protein, partial [Stenotrophomonas maltophilia]|uniref:hypothetical protein n=1 Tax=Stenotrophomonas maltophilia TaxID=40324 RepID=UPI001A7E1AD6
MSRADPAPVGAGSSLAQGARAPVRPGLPGGGHRLRSPAACRRARACRNALSITPDRACGACPARAWQRHPPLLLALRAVGSFGMA